MRTKTVVNPSLLDALIPVLFLIVSLYFSVTLYGPSSSYGANQLALILSGCIAIVIGFKNGNSWKTIEHAISEGISKSINALFILLMVGSLIGTWILSGTVPAMIYYGLQIIHPDVFYVTACILCALTSLSIGSSWSTAGTIGVGLMGVAFGLGLSPAITAGAIISGAYFGDKLSPLSDTTNLASASTETDIFEHIRHMLWTTVPSISLALMLYLIIGLNSSPITGEINIGENLRLIEQNFNIGPHLFIPLIVVFYMAIKKYPAFPTLTIGMLLGAVFAVVFQPETIHTFSLLATERSMSPDEFAAYSAQVQNGNISPAMQTLDGVWRAMVDRFMISSGNPEFDELFYNGGMTKMVNTVWLAMCSMFFGSIMERLGMLQRVVDSLVKSVKTTGGLILTTAASCISVNILSGDQYMAIILPGRMFRAEFKAKNLASKNLSRAVEDTATMTSVLVPWNTCSVYMFGVLGVSAFAFAPFCFFNIISPCMTILYGYLNFKIEPLAEQAVTEEVPEKTL
ncbi:Na+/H+ antiporter NhaC [Kordiimonas pumila]|uniref:Na+/H+ antiporter NhaC n=1 Tax=Kordiimonas pumila TaxID=2161677 RepID=A0ABV7D509_9PROT|nr:Na+/H+ antiporter NhaC [Kordiimonas pumila]